MTTKLERDGQSPDAVWLDRSESVIGQFSIGDLAREYGVSLRTLRFYESKGLLKPRRNGTARLYGAEDRQRVGLILQGKKLGFTLAEIRQLLAERVNSKLTADLKLTPQQCLEQLKVLERQKSQLEEAIVVLKQTYAALHEHSNGSTADNQRAEAASR